MNYRHWNARYVRDRVAVAWYERQHRDFPWMTAAAVANTVAMWRVFWTSSGVTDTAIYFKPGNHRVLVES